VTERGQRDDATLAAWAEEHLVYEVDQLVYALERLADEEPESRAANLALESFAVHARCLFEFLWFKPKEQYEDDAFASDFSAEWNERRNAIPPHLAEVKDRRRFGQEVFHLTYERMAVFDDEKVWLCGEMAMEIAAALKLFAALARDDALDDDTRALLGSVTIKVKGNDGRVAEEILRLDYRTVAAFSGATTMAASEITGGTINVANLARGS
jgi:hypothetical protein